MTQGEARPSQPTRSFLTFDRCGRRGHSGDKRRDGLLAPPRCYQCGVAGGIGVLRDQALPLAWRSTSVRSWSG